MKYSIIMLLCAIMISTTSIDASGNDYRANAAIHKNFEVLSIESQKIIGGEGTWNGGCCSGDSTREECRGLPGMTLDSCDNYSEEDCGDVNGPALTLVGQCDGWPAGNKWCYWQGDVVCRITIYCSWSTALNECIQDAFPDEDEDGDDTCSSNSPPAS